MPMVNGKKYAYTEKGKAAAKKAAAKKTAKKTKNSRSQGQHTLSNGYAMGMQWVCKQERRDKRKENTG